MTFGELEGVYLRDIEDRRQKAEEREGFYMPGRY